jgi:hypothetical protein
LRGFGTEEKVFVDEIHGASLARVQRVPLMMSIVS